MYKQFQNIIRGIYAKYHYKSCYYLPSVIIIPSVIFQFFFHNPYIQKFSILHNFKFLPLIFIH